MIYGNRFYKYGVFESTDTISIDIDNCMSLFSEFCKESSDEVIKENLDKALDKLDTKVEHVYDIITAKITEMLNKFIDAISHAIDILKLKVLKLGNKIINAIDSKINGKFNYSTSDISQYNGANLINFESALQEKAGENASEYLYAMNISKIEYIKVDNTIDDLLDLVQDIWESYSKFLKYYDIDDMKQKAQEVLNKYVGDYKKIYDKSVTHISSKIGSTYYTLKDDLEQLPSIKNGNKDSTENGFFEIIKVDVSSKKGLVDLRDGVRSELSDSENILKNIIQIKDSTMKLKRKVDTLGVKLNANKRLAASNNNHILYWGENIDVPKQALSDIAHICEYQIKCVSEEIKSILYINKHNFSLAIRYIKKWGEEKEASTNSLGIEDKAGK